MLDGSDDQQLALAAASGDRAAFRRLVETHYDLIHALAWRFANGPPECEDLAQDVCAALGARIRSYRGQSAFRTWLYRVVLNAARDRFRRETAQRSALRQFAELDELRRGEETARARDADWLRAAIATLKQDLRETAILVLDQGLSHAEAAQVLELSEGTVSWRLSEIRKALSRLATEEGAAP